MGKASGATSAGGTVFVKPNDYYEYTILWGMMDTIVSATKGGDALRRWEREAVPMVRDGKVRSPAFANFPGRGGRSVYRAIRIDDLRKDRFRFEDAIREDMDDYGRLYRLFAETMAA